MLQASTDQGDQDGQSFAAVGDGDHRGANPPVCGPHVAKLRTGAKTRRDDPRTPSDDPAKGMTGHE